MITYNQFLKYQCLYRGNTTPIIGVAGTATDVTFTDGVAGQSASFNGSSSKILDPVGKMQGVYGTSGKFTLITYAWFDVLSGVQSIWAQLSTTAAKQVGCYITGDKVWFHHYDGGFQNIVGATSLTTNQWHCIAYVQDGANCAVYLNGNLDASGSIAGVADPAPTGIYSAIGVERYAASGYEYWLDGRLFNLCIYDGCALPIVDIRRYMRNASPTGRA